MTRLAAAVTRPDDSSGRVGCCGADGSAHLSRADESDDCHLDFSIFSYRKRLYLSFLYQNALYLEEVFGDLVYVSQYLIFVLTGLQENQPGDTHVFKLFNHFICQWNTRSDADFQFTQIRASVG